MTFSLLGHCPHTGMLGMVVSSSSPAVAARCANARAGVGAAASQNVTDPRLGVRLIESMAAGRPAVEALEAVVAGAGSGIEHRQLAAVDASGGTAGFSGPRTLGRNAIATGLGVIAAGNLLSDTAVVDAMVRCFEQMDGAAVHLGDRLVAGLAAGLEAGGEVGPVRSAGLLLCDRVEWPVADLRVDWHDAPIGALARLWELWRPQIDDYVTRALDPAAAPSYGVVGDE